MKSRPRIPYGVWTCADGRTVLFDRQYKPMWQRVPGGMATPADPAERVPFATERWLWSGATPKRERVAVAAAALSAWGVLG